MAEFLEQPGVRWVLMAAILSALIAVGWYVIGLVRREMTTQAPGASEWMSSFRDLHEHGMLSDDEYKTIKNSLANRLRGAAREVDGKGLSCPPGAIMPDRLIPPMPVEPSDEPKLDDTPPAADGESDKGVDEQ